MIRFLPLAALLSAGIAAAQGPAPLSPDEAARLAVARNPAYRALLQEEGVAQADLEQAGLPANPRAHGNLRYIGTERGARGHELGISFDLLSLVEMPLKKKVASGRLEQVKFRIGDETLGLETRVKEAYHEAQAAARRRLLTADVLKALDADAELARRQRAAGTLSALRLAEVLSAREEGAAQLAAAEASAVRARERLALLLGVGGGEDWSIEEAARPLPAGDPDAAAAEQAALSRRWDLQAARKDPEVLRAARRAERVALFGSVELGMDYSREYGGASGYGPEFEFRVPLFDRRQKAVARLEAQRRQSLASVEALEAQARYEVRSAAAALAAARKAAAAREAALPLEREAVAETLKNYNFMLLGADKLLAAKRRELEAEMAAAEARAEYWTRRAELERAAGGPL